MTVPPTPARPAELSTGGGPGSVGGVALVLLQVGDRLVDGLVHAGGVAADHPVDEARRLVEIFGVGQQVGVLPDRVAGVGADGLREALPQNRRLTQLARA